MINSTLKEKWVEALRSGNYKQTDGCLKRTSILKDAKDGFCCLGVLCDIVAPLQWSTAPEGEEYSIHSFAFMGATSDSVLPRPLQEIVGLKVMEQGRLTELNDNGVSFSTIADWIEANL